MECGQWPANAIEIRFYFLYISRVSFLFVVKQLLSFSFLLLDIRDLLFKKKMSTSARTTMFVFLNFYWTSLFLHFDLYVIKSKDSSFLEKKSLICNYVKIVCKYELKTECINLISVKINVLFCFFFLIPFSYSFFFDVISL